MVHSEPTRFYSTGGIGDAFIVLLKLKEWCMRNTGSTLDWLHIEQTDIRTEFDSLLPWVPSVVSHASRIECIHDPAYVQHVTERKWAERVVIPTPVAGICPFHGKEWRLSDPFLDDELPSDRRYDICIQVSAGQTHNRRWRFAPRLVKERYKHLKVAFVGNDPLFSDERDEDNLVCRQHLSAALGTVRHSRLFIGLSGVMNYFACASRIPNIHLIEGDRLEEQYYHHDWKDVTVGIRHGSLPEVVLSIRSMGHADPETRSSANP